MMLTIQQAATLTHRSPRAIYNWIETGKLAAILDDFGVRRVDGKELFRVEATIRRGRPRTTRE